MHGELIIRPISIGSNFGKHRGREELTVAMDIYREMEMTYWLEKAEEVLVEVSVANY